MSVFLRIVCAWVCLLTGVASAQRSWQSEDLPGRVRRWIVEPTSGMDRREPKADPVLLPRRARTETEDRAGTPALYDSARTQLRILVIGAAVVSLAGIVLALARHRRKTSQARDELSAEARDLLRRALGLRDDPRAILRACHRAAIALAALRGSGRVRTTTDGRLSAGVLESERSTFVAITQAYAGVAYGGGEIDRRGAELVRCSLVTLVSASGTSAKDVAEIDRR